MLKKASASGQSRARPRGEHSRGPAHSAPGVQRYFAIDSASLSAAAAAQLSTKSSTKEPSRATRASTFSAGALMAMACLLEVYVPGELRIRLLEHGCCRRRAPRALP